MVFYFIFPNPRAHRRPDHTPRSDPSSSRRDHPIPSPAMKETAQAHRGKQQKQKAEEKGTGSIRVKSWGVQQKGKGRDFVSKKGLFVLLVVESSEQLSSGRSKAAQFRGSGSTFPCG